MENGEPDGRFFDNAMEPVYDSIPVPSKEEIKDINPIYKEGRQTFLGYENQNHGHNDNNQRQTGKGQAFP